MRSRVAKRGLDLVVSVVGLTVCAPAMVVISALVWIGLGRPVLFRQRRPGLEGRLFTLLKFRTMSAGCAADGSLLPDGQRLTTLGSLLRATSLDELPTFFNVLRGDMSLVGPRPLLERYLSRYTSEQRRRHEVKPGITGWAQVNGRNAITWEEKFALDVWYVDNWSLWLDLKILLLTAGRVLRSEGINQPGLATMEEFIGSES